MAAVACLFGMGFMIADQRRGGVLVVDPPRGREENLGKRRQTGRGIAAAWEEERWSSCNALWIVLVSRKIAGSKLKFRDGERVGSRYDCIVTI